METKANWWIYWHSLICDRLHNQCLRWRKSARPRHCRRCSWFDITSTPCPRLENPREQVRESLKESWLNLLHFSQSNVSLIHPLLQPSSVVSPLSLKSKKTIQTIDVTKVFFGWYNWYSERDSNSLLLAYYFLRFKQCPRLGGLEPIWVRGRAAPPTLNGWLL